MIAPRLSGFFARAARFVVDAPPGVPERERRRFVTRNIASAGAVVAHAVLAVGYTALEQPFLAAWSLAVVPYFVVLLEMNRRGFWLFSAAAGAVEAALHIGACAWILGPESGASYLLVPLALAPVGIGSDDRRVTLLCALLPMAVFFAIRELPVAPWALPPAEILRALWKLNTSTAFLGTATIATYAARVSDSVEGALAEERRRTRELLEVIVPSRIADRILAGERRIADAVPEVAVFFADLSGFTAWSSGRAPLEVVQLLEGVFERLDDLAHEHRVEKIKTIGDAYMAVCAPTRAGDDHVERLATFALDVVEAVRTMADERGIVLRARAGVHVGPAVAGVIGRTRFTFDLWGDTVNVASRMESTGEVDRVHVSVAVAERVRGHFAVERRGEIRVKGKGALETYWLMRAAG